MTAFSTAPFAGIAQGLHPAEAVIDDDLHVASRQRVPEADGDVVQHDEQQIGADEQAPGLPGFSQLPGAAAPACAKRSETTSRPASIATR